MADEPTTAEKPEEPQSVGMAIANAAELTKTLMKNFGYNFNQAWTIVKDGMDRQQHYGDNQVALLLGGYQSREAIQAASVFDAEEVDDEENEEDET